MQESIQASATESLLLSIIEGASKLLDGGECSIFVLNEETDRYILRESTKMSRFIHNFHLPITDVHKNQYSCYRKQLRSSAPAEDETLKNIGLTVYALLSREPLVVDDVRNDVRWSDYGRHFQDVISKHCEVSTGRIGAFMAIPLRNPHSTKKRPMAVFRAARDRDSLRPFTAKEKQTLVAYLDQQAAKILNSRSLASLIEVGSIFDLENLCTQVVNTLKTIIGAEGCSIFLVDEDRWKKGERVFRCVATTGLRDRDGNQVSQGNALYDLDKDKNTLTVWVIENRQNCIIDDVTKYDFRDILGLNRLNACGKYNEYFDNDGKSWTGAVMLAPVFYRERTGTYEDVAGVIRITKSEKEGRFDSTQVRLFISFADKLSKTISNVKYVTLLNTLATIKEPKELYRALVNQVPKIVGGRGCSIFMINEKGQLQLEDSIGLLRGQKDWYDPSDPEGGFTSWVAYYKKPLWYNDPEELGRKHYEGKKPKHSGKTKCEVDGSVPPQRFLAVPIIGPPQEDNVLGVLRVAKKKEDTPITETDVRILESLVVRLPQVFKAVTARESLDVLLEIGQHVTSISSPVDSDIGKYRSEIVGNIITAAQRLFSPDEYRTTIRRRETNEQDEDILVAVGPRREGLKLRNWKFGECIVGWVAEQNTPVIINNVLDPKEYLKYGITRNLFEDAMERVKDDLLYVARLENTKAEMAVPLNIGDKVIGVINIHSGRTNCFSQRDLWLLRSFANYAAIALNNIELIENRQSQNSKINLLIERISDVLSNEESIERICFYFLTAITHRDGLGINRIILFEYDSKAKVLIGITGKGPANAEEATVFKRRFDKNELLLLDDCLNEYDKEKGTWVGSMKLKNAVSSKLLKCYEPDCAIARYVNSASQDILCVEFIDISEANRAVLKQFDITKFALAPVFTGGKLHGILVVDNIYRGNRRLDESQLETLRLFVKQFGLLIQNAKTLAATKIKTLHLAEISHDILGPLNAVHSNIKILRNEKDSTLPKHQEILDLVHENAGHLRELISDIIDISEIETEHIKLKPDDFDFSAMLKALENNYTIAADKKKLSFKMFQSDDVPQYLYSDSKKIKKVFVNLLDNAVKFTKKGSIKMRVECEGWENASVETHGIPAVSSTSVGTPVRIAVEIEDTGPGIRQEDRSSVFVRFWQGLTGRRVGEGTGLGMGIAKNYAQSMGGDVVIKQSTVGKGTTFRFSFGAYTGDKARLKKKLPEVVKLKSNQKQYTILIVENEINEREPLRYLLENVGFAVREASDGEEALKCVEEHSPSLVLMDIRMPGMSGLDTTSRLKKTAKGKTTPVIMVTTEGKIDTRQEAMLIGAVDFFTKPYDMDEIYEKIRCVLGVEYEYKSEDDVSLFEPFILGPQSPLDRISEELRNEMMLACYKGERKKMLELVNIVGKNDAKGAEAIRSLAKKFQWSRLIEVLEEGRSGHAPRC